VEPGPELGLLTGLLRDFGASLPTVANLRSIVLPILSYLLV
jgi:hypothetical protein